MAKQTPIAVVGISAVFPGSVDATGFWNDIVCGRDLIREVPPTHWLKEDYYDPDPSTPDKTYAVRGAFLDAVPFDPLEWGVPPSIVPATDTTQLLALIVAKRVLQDATRGRWPEVDRDRISCILGVTSAQELLGTMVNRLQAPVWAKAIRELGYAETEVDAICERIADQYVPWQESTFPGLLGNVVAGRIANRLDLGGTNCVTDAACASSFSAIAMAHERAVARPERSGDQRRRGHDERHLHVHVLQQDAGAVEVGRVPRRSRQGGRHPARRRARHGRAQAPGRRRAGRRQDLRGDQGDRLVAPTAAPRACTPPCPRARPRPWAAPTMQAGYGPETVELVEAHGTGTKAGDAAEFEGLKLAFDASGRDDRQWCALGTVKSQIGHTKAAAGAAGLFKMVMALNHRVLPPTIKIETPNPKLGVERSPFYLNTTARPWIRGSAHPRRASVSSSFGFGGSNFHLALEEYTGPSGRAVRNRTLPTELVALSAADPAALARSAREVAEALADGGASPNGWRIAAHKAAHDYDPALPARLAVVCKDAIDLKKKLLDLAGRIEAAPADPVISPTGAFYALGADPGRIGFLFPGQGSQYVSMGADVAMAFDAARAVWDAAADLALGPEPLHEVVFPRPTFTPEDRKRADDKLRATEWSQPALGAHSLALLALLERLQLRPEVVGGHSYGEISALAAAGALSVADALVVARQRGERMAAAATIDGAMTAVPRPIEEVQAHADAIEGCAIANHNAPSQVVVSGPTEAIEALERRLDEAGIEPKRLVVATAFHSPVVADAVGPFASFLEGVTFTRPSMPVYHNADAAPYPDDPTRYGERLAQAIAKPVRFVDQIEAMYASGVRTFVEVGPHGVLSGLVGEILGDRPHTAAPLDRRRKNGVTALHIGLARLVAAGVPIALSALWEDYEVPTEAEAVSRVAIPIDGANHKKPYPPPGGAAALPAPNPVRTGFARSLDPAPEVVERVVEKVVEVQVPVAVAGNPPGSEQMSDPSRPSGPPAPVDPWVAAFQEAQRATVDAHTAYQRAMADSHSEFLRTLEQSFAGLTRMAGVEAPAAATAPAPAHIPRPPAIAAPIAVPAESLSSLPPPTWTPTTTAAGTATPLVQSGVDLVGPTAAPAPKPAATAVVPSPAAVPAAPVGVAVAAAIDLEGLLLEVVAEKTGYPADMLGMHMALESDLGVDSIKRVEILSAVRERAPDLPEVDASEMAKLQTLGQVVDHLKVALPAGAAVPASASAAATLGAAAVSAASPEGGGGAAAVDVAGLLLEVVAEKTGYPADMLGMHMALESDLGVDSIKRVEILSAVRERAPDLPEVDASEMAKLQTLGQVVDHLKEALPAGAISTSPAANAPATVGGAGLAASAASVDVAGLLLEVVAEKTGYPADMLGMHMALESDLGVDSIKRVEILSAVRERAPDLPEVDAAEMAKLQTLGQVVDHLKIALPATAHGSAARPGSAGSGASGSGAAAAAVDVAGLLLEVVAEKTGYPADMLGMHMALESDLGVDSIKRVEILSAVRERAPDLPEVDAAEMAKLQTLGQVVDHLKVALPDAPEPASSASSASGQGGAAGEGAGTDPTEAADTAALGRWTLEAVPAPALGLSQPGLHPGARIAICPPGALADALQRTLRSEGFDQVEVVASPGPAEPTDAFDAIVLLHGATDDPVDDANRDAFRAARAVAGAFASRGGLLITVQDTGGDFGLSGSDRAERAGMAGLAKTAAQEWTAASTKAIDLADAGADADASARKLVDELLRGGVEPEVGLRADGTRIALRSVPTPVEATAPAIARDTVIVATGGARGVTARCLVALARASGGRYALLGRTVLAEEPAGIAQITDDTGLKRALLDAAKANGEAITPADLGRKVAKIQSSREIRATLAELRQAGAEAVYVSVDASDADAVAAALAEVRRKWGAIGAVVHGAGVLADKRIAEKTDEAFDRVVGVKVDGIRALLRATADDPLKAVILFSSVAGRTGNQGQVDYAMANEVLAKVAAREQARRPDAVVRALQWGPWAGGMVTPELAAHFRSAGVPLIPLQTGAGWLVEELADRRGATEVVLGGAPRMAPLASAPDSERRGVRLRVRVDARTAPYLADHKVAGTPVVPVVLVLEWFARAARATRPDLVLTDMSELKVLKGIRLGAFEGAGDWFDIVADEVTNGAGSVLALELRGLDGARHYSATATLADRAVDPPHGPAQRGLPPWSGEAIYDGDVLFHGDAFQVIRTLDGISDQGIDATLSSTRQQSWPNEGWHTDPAALDGGLQLALLWSHRMLGGPSLPMSVLSFRTFADGPPPGPVRAVLTGERRGSDKTVTDIVLIDESTGVVVNELRGVEAIRRPD